jgi:hypothetical protein
MRWNELKWFFVVLVVALFNVPWAMLIRWAKGEIDGPRKSVL